MSCYTDRTLNYDNECICKDSYYESGSVCVACHYTW